jgi:hypothetical protein
MKKSVHFEHVSLIKKKKKKKKLFEKNTLCHKLS